MKIDYKPLLTEIEGIQDIATGFIFLGASTACKAKECFTGVSTYNKELQMNQSKMYLNASFVCFYLGFEQVLPTTGVILAAYCIGNQLLSNGEKI